MLPHSPEMVQLVRRERERDRDRETEKEDYYLMYNNRLPFWDISTNCVFQQMQQPWALHQ